MKERELEQMYVEGLLESPHRLRNLREEIVEYTGLDVPHRIGEVRQWWRDHKSVFSKRIGSEEKSEEGDH